MDDFPFTQAWMDAVNTSTERLARLTNRVGKCERVGFERNVQAHALMFARLAKVADALGIAFDDTDHDYADAYAEACGKAIYEEDKTLEQAYSAGRVAGAIARGKAKQLIRDAKPRLSRSGVAGSAVEVFE